MYIFINLASARCNPKKPASRGSPCGVTITVTNAVTATNLPLPPLYPTFLTPYSSCDTLPPKTFIIPRYQDAEKVLFTMSGDGSLGSWSRKIIHSPSPRRNIGFILPGNYPILPGNSAFPMIFIG